MEIADTVYDKSKQLPDGVKVVTYAENQTEYRPLPCVRLPDGQIATRWLLDVNERSLVYASGEIYLCISTFNQPLQPLLMMADCPEIGTDDNYQMFFYSRLEHLKSHPKVFRDEIRIFTEVHLSFWDRIRILFGRVLHVETKTKTEVIQAGYETSSRCWVEPFIKREESVIQLRKREVNQ